jgi:hypothetical protein
MDYKCLQCLHAYDSADLMIRCRINGLLTSPANAEACKRFEQDTREDDDITALVDPCCWLGRGD